MSGREPRFTGTFWVMHGARMAKMAQLLWDGHVAQAAKLVSDDPTEWAALATAFKAALNGAGYNDDGTLAHPGDPNAFNAPFHFAFIAKPGESWSERVNGPCRVSVHVLDGNQVWLGYSAAPGQYIEGQAGAANGAYEVHVPAGAWYVSVKMGDGFAPRSAGVDGFPE